MIYRLDAACSSHIGRIRRSNEDNLFFAGHYLEAEHDHTEHPLLDHRVIPAVWTASVFDGMGGENYGELASFTAAEHMASSPMRWRDHFRPGEEYLSALAQALNSAVVCAQQQMQTQRMGTTMVSLMLHSGNAYICNLGDSRAYCLRSGDLVQLSVDHVAPRLARPGRKPPLTQHLGIDPEEMIIEPHIAVQKYHRGDWYLLCSDGLTDMVTEEEIARILSDAENAASCAEALIASALEHGGRDNITVIAVRIL